METTKGYKVTDANMKCRSYQFELNKLFVQSGELEICENGFHFCQKASHCFNYYDFITTNRVFEIEAYGEIETQDDKSCTLQIKIVRELTWPEVLVVVNEGLNNTGHSNSGDRNSGYRNSGDRNSGDRNSGNSNSGDRNSGDRNSGDRNSGDRNSGNWNSGYRNSGDRNSGNWNSGDRNSGDSNSGYRNSGAFCTDANPTLLLFNKPSKYTVKEWESHPACELMYKIENTIWVPDYAMSEDERKSNPKWETTEGYLKTIPMKEAWKNFWFNLTDANKELFTSLENFDEKIFEEITGIKI